MKVYIIFSAMALLLSPQPLSQVSQNNAYIAPLAVDFRQQDPALTQYGTISAENRWERNVITVCWLNHPEFATQRAWVEHAVRSTWMASSSVRFSGWKDCAHEGADVKIQISDDLAAPRSFVGKSSIGHSPSMWLNVTFKSWGKSCQSKIKACVEAIAAHEFGHVAGFEHEQLQPDAPKACVDHLKNTGAWEVIDHNPTPLTPYDPDSIMNYCNSIWLNNGSLSANDKKAILMLFPLA